MGWEVCRADSQTSNYLTPMKFIETPLIGAFVIELDRQADERGFFARTWCKEEFDKRNLDSELDQCSVSFNAKRQTLRGLHYQEEPYGESKVVRCTRGKIFDVIVDLRKTSESYRNWFGVELSDSNYLSLYVPKGFAHGFLTLEDSTEVFYQ